MGTRWQQLSQLLQQAPSSSHGNSKVYESLRHATVLHKQQPRDPVFSPVKFLHALIKCLTSLRFLIIPPPPQLLTAAYIDNAPPKSMTLSHMGRQRMKQMGLDGSTKSKNKKHPKPGSKHAQARSQLERPKARKPNDAAFDSLNTLAYNKLFHK